MSIQLGGVAFNRRTGHKMNLHVGMKVVCVDYRQITPDD